MTILITLISCNKDDNPTTPTDNASEQKTVNLTVDGNARSFIVYLPTGYNNAGKMPMISPALSAFNAATYEGAPLLRSTLMWCIPRIKGPAIL